MGTCVLSSYVDIYLKMSRCSDPFIQHTQPNLSKKQNSRVQFPPAIRQVSLEQWRRLREERLELSQRAICALRTACVNKARPATASRRTHRELINKETCRTRIQSIQHHETRSLSRSGGCVITMCPDQSYYSVPRSVILQCAPISHITVCPDQSYYSVPRSVILQCAPISHITVCPDQSYYSVPRSVILQCAPISHITVCPDQSYYSVPRSVIFTISLLLSAAVC